jgi:hypothetical protein
MPLQEMPVTNDFRMRRDKPLIGVISSENDQEVVTYFTDEDETDQMVTSSCITRALSLAGAWKDLGSWEDAQAELDRIRHESRPTPPLEL